MSDFTVSCYIYDISRGMARSMSQALIGKHLDGIWHTGIVAYGQEFFFGGGGVESCDPCGTILGQPDKKVTLGSTQIPFEVFMDYLQELASTTFRPECYHLLDHNCNTFSNEVAQFLTGKPIPSYVTNLPGEVLQTPFGAMIRPFIDSMSHSMSPVGSGSHRILGSGASAAATPPGGEKNKQSAKPRAEKPAMPTSPTSERNNPATKQSTAKSKKTVDHKPILFGDKSPVEQFAKLKAGLASRDQELMGEVQEYLLSEQPTWSLGRDHLMAIGSCVMSEEVSSEIKCGLLGMLRLCCLREEFLQVLTHTKDNKIITYLARIEHLPPIEQKEIVKLLCNLCCCRMGFDWLMSKREEKLELQVMCNAKVTSRCCVTSLLSDDSASRELGATLGFNLAIYKVDDESAVEIGSAIIQLLSAETTEPLAFMSLVALKKCLDINCEVTGIAQVLGLDLSRYQGLSSRVKSLVESIKEKHAL